jgi:hypothetical protein
MDKETQGNGVDFLEGRAIELLRRDVFPDGWAFVPVAGKATFVKEWSTKPLTRIECMTAYQLRQDYVGLGVVTGSFSGGLLALDIDGHDADERYREVAGEEYEPYGEEKTMSWTSGKPGRRQILYQVPKRLVAELEHVKTLILRTDDGKWHLGHGDTNRGAGGDVDVISGAAYEEVVLRFNACQSVVPGSPHPDTKQPYRFLNYNEGQVATAPQWVLDVLRPHRKPVQWLSEAEQKEVMNDLGGQTAVPPRQIRGWFFKEEVQALLRPRLEELVFRHEVFDQYGWKSRSGDNPQRMSGCPWHGGRSGTTFQYAAETGCWDCKACGVGGDVLDFVHKVRTKDMHAGRPNGPDLEAYVAELAGELGYDYPACATATEVTIKDAPLKRLTGEEFFTTAARIINGYDNAELAHYQLMELVRDSGLTHVYKSGPQVESALERFLLHQEQVVTDPNWQEKVRGDRDYLIPDFMSKPSSVMLHARGGMGKTRLAVLISKIVGQKRPMKVRGLTVEPTVSGNVLFIGNDMSMTDYAEYFDQQGIDSSGADRWMHFKPQWQQSQYRVLVRWLEEIKPVLVVVDSLTSVSMMIAAKEYEKEYANTLYRLARENGTAFPATTFLWIHHNTKDGTKFRGTDTLRNAVHETWELKELTDEERAQYGDHALILEIDKSRGMRGGDRFLVREDIEEALSIEDLTPTVTRENGGNGDEQPRTIVLGILKEAEAPMTAKELRYALNARLAGRRGPGTCVSEKTVKRWVQRWVVAGLVEESVVRQGGQKGGRPCTGFSVKGPITEPQNVQNPPLFFENGSRGRDLGFGQGSAENVQNLEVSKTPEVETVQADTVADETHTTEPSVENLGKNYPQSGPEVLDISDTEEGLSKTSEAETLSSTGVSENGSEVLDTASEIYGTPLSTQDYGDWEDEGWVADLTQATPMGKRESFKAISDFDGCIDVHAEEVP